MTIRDGFAEGPVRLCWQDLPSVTAVQMAAVDRVATDEVGLSLPVMMENAGRDLARLTRALYDLQQVTVLIGPGGNGGGGLVAARHLANRGLAVEVVLATDQVHEVTARQLAITRAMSLPVRNGPPPHQEDRVVLDALLGYSLRGQPTSRYAELIEWANTQPGPVLSLDTPSGLDVTTGSPAVPCVRADATLTLALPKTGLLGAPEAGRLFLADIGIPLAVHDRLGIGSVALPADLVELVAPATHAER